jgi:hypothetical protein
MNGFSAPTGPKQGEHHAQHPDQGRVGVEVLGQATAHPGQLPIGSAAVELAGLGHGATFRDACRRWRLTGVSAAVSPAGCPVPDYLVLASCRPLPADALLDANAGGAAALLSCACDRGAVQVGGAWAGGAGTISRSAGGQAGEEGGEAAG